MFKQTLSDRVRSLMNAQGFNQFTLAQRSGVDRTVINRLLNRGHIPSSTASLCRAGRGFQSVLGKDALDRVSFELVTEVAERTAEPGVAPGWVLGGSGERQA